MGSYTDTLPPFPENIPTAPIASISLNKLLNSDDAEGKKVLEACKTFGFFYLDLSQSSVGQSLIDDSEKLHALAQEAFKLPLEEKQKFALVKGVSLFGYKEAGTVKLTDKELRPDTTEFFNVSKDHMHGFVESRIYPPQIQAEKSVFQTFSKNAHATGMLILKTLATHLGLQPSAFTELNEFESPSGDHVRLTKKVPHRTDRESRAVGLPSHTDFGSITILFNWLGGLQIQSHDSSKLGEWEYVRPIREHAIINLGDAMVKFTSGALKSAKHRVVPAPGGQVDVDRYSVVYFVRPANASLMVPVGRFKDEQTNGYKREKWEDEMAVGKVYTAGEWMRQRGIQMGS